MGATLVEKLLAAKCEHKTAHGGEIISVEVDRLMINDYVGSLIFSKLNEMQKDTIVHPERVYLATDHNFPAFTVDAADKLVLFREKAEQYGITHMTRAGWHGISHQLMVEHFTRPLEIAVGTDSHATMYAGLGAFSCGITTSDAIGALINGRVWLKVPETIRVEINGVLPKGVTAKDLALYIISMRPEIYFTYKAVELVGRTVDAMSVESRLVMANLMAEAGAKCAVFEADEKSYAYAGVPFGEHWSSDPNAAFADVIQLDVSNLEPCAACPDKTVNVHPISEIAGRHIDQVFIGSCTNGRLEDLRQAAEILKNRRIAEGTRLLVTPASQSIFLEAEKEGIVRILLDAGAMILSSSCASCAGMGPGLIGRGECCFSTTNRNFKGRMGSKDADVYLGSAYAAAACAVTGRITDPRTLLTEETNA